MPGTNNVFDIITMTIYYILYKLPPEMTRNKNRARNRGNMVEGSEKQNGKNRIRTELKQERRITRNNGRTIKIKM